MATAKTDLKRKQLVKMQAPSSAVWNDYRKSNLDIYKHIAQI
jgi:hypothetical protein